MAATEPRNPYAVPYRLEILITELGTTTTIGLSGECDLAEQHAIRDAIQRAVDRSPECVVLDLSQLSFIDSCGIHVVLDLANCAARQDIRVVIIPGPRAVQRPFEVLGLIETLPFLGSAGNLGTARPRSGHLRAAGSGGSRFSPPATSAGPSSRGRRR
jgi:anti-sigma B factor antagonist